MMRKDVRGAVVLLASIAGSVLGQVEGSALDDALNAILPQGASRDQGEGHVNVNSSGLIEIHFKGMDLRAVLDMLSRESQRNIIASPAVSGLVTCSIYDVDFDSALRAILRQNNADYMVEGNFIYVYTLEEMANLFLAPPEGRAIFLDYLNAKEAAKIAEPLLSEGGTVVLSGDVEAGIASSAEQAGGQNYAAGDYIFVHDRPEVIDRIEETLRKLDVRPQQVLIEATILRATLSDENSLGIDFTVVGGVDLELLGSTSQGVRNLAVGELPQERFELFNSNVTTEFTGDVPPGGVSFGVIKDHVAVFLRALEQVTDASVIANPKVLVLNKQKGQFIVGRRDGYLTTSFTDAIATQTIEFLETGTTLIFRPFIGKDGFIRVELHPEDSTGGVDSGGLPFEQTTEVTTNIMVRDGHTILIGGLFREVINDTRSQIPGLGSTPVIGPLFRSHSDSVQREEVIILLTVHIVKDYLGYEKESGEAWQDVERTRVGQRAGMKWAGRERLAQSNYHLAAEAYQAGDKAKALWYDNLALHCSPRHTQALKLKEELTQSRLWDDEGSATRDFMYRVLKLDHPGIPPYYGRPTLEPRQTGVEGSATQESEGKEVADDAGN